MACKQYRKGKIGIATKYPNNTLTSIASGYTIHHTTTTTTATNRLPCTTPCSRTTGCQQQSLNTCMFTTLTVEQRTSVTPQGVIAAKYHRAVKTILTNRFFVLFLHLIVSANVGFSHTKLRQANQAKTSLPSPR
jgi:hypothetical protein